MQNLPTLRVHHENAINGGADLGFKKRRLPAQFRIRLFAFGDVPAGAERTFPPALLIMKDLPLFLNELDPAIGHQQSVFERVYGLLSERLVESLIHRSAVCRMHEVQKILVRRLKLFGRDLKDAIGLG